jgi:hypothetical protein
VLSAAAVVVLLLFRPTSPSTSLPLSQRSRPSSALIGKIPPERAADARARLDTIYADRLAGYREIALFSPRAR